MEDNAFDKLKSMLNNGNVPPDLQNIISNINSNNSSSQNSNISPEAISNLVNLLNSNTKSNDSKEESGNSNVNKDGNLNFDFDTILKLKSVMDKMNSKDDSRARLLMALKPYLKDSRRSKVDQYIQFFNMSKVMEILSKPKGDDKL